jgi:hypothetical protein
LQLAKIAKFSLEMKEHVARKMDAAEEAVLAAARGKLLTEDDIEAARAEGGRVAEADLLRFGLARVAKGEEARAEARAAAAHGQVLQLLMKPLLLQPAKDLAPERALGAPPTAVDAVVGEPQLLGAAWSSAPDVCGCNCGSGSGGSGGGGGLDGNLLLCWRC